MNIICRTKGRVAFFLTITLCILSFFANGQTDTTVYLIYNARIVDVVKGNIRTENAVLINKGRIQSIGDYSKLNKNIPSNHLIDAGNRFLIPGLWDMHVHLEGEDLVADNKALLPIFITYGVTTIRDAASDLGEQVLAWRNEINQGKLFGPTIFTAGLKLEGINSIWKGDLEISNEEELNQALNKLDSWHVDFVKITENTLKGPLFLKSIKAAHARGYIVSGHVPMDLTIEEMADAGFSSVEHSSYLLRLGYDEKEIVANLKSGKISATEANNLYQGEFNQQKAIKGYEALAKKGLAVTPTLIGGKQLANFDRDIYLRDSMMVKYLTTLYTSKYQWRIDRMSKETPEQTAERKKKYALGASQVPLMQKAGLLILAGSDAAALNSFIYPGESLVSELQLYQEAGMQPPDILRTATINGAKFMRRFDTMGSVDEGKVADLVLLEENPLQSIAAVKKIYAVFTKGRYLDRRALDQILADVRDAKRRLDKERGS
jgi:imidazolonepropionase-like amidohydrolase